MNDIGFFEELVSVYIYIYIYIYIYVCSAKKIDSKLSTNSV